MVELHATGYTTTASAFIIAATPTCICHDPVDTLYNGELFKLVTCITVPAMTSILPVYITVNGVNYPVQDIIGNNLMSDKIHSRRRYRLVFGTNPAHFKLTTCVGTSQATGESI